MRWFRTNEGVAARMSERCRVFDEALAMQDGVQGKGIEHLITLQRKRCLDWDAFACRFAACDDYAQCRDGLLVAPAGLAWIPVFWTYYYVKWQSGMGTIHRLTRALANGACPDCDYQLAVRDFEMLRNAGVQLSACKACPECGSAWPLVPPAIAGHGRKAGVV